MKVHRPFCEMPVNCCMILINVLFYRLIKYADIKFNGNPSSVSRVFFSMRMDGKTKMNGYDETYGRFPQFC